MDGSGVTWTDIAGVIIVALQLMLLVVAARFGRDQVNEARDQVDEARRLREEQTRPFVVLDLVSEEPPFFFLVVKNYGSSMARDVKFEFDQEPETTIDHARLERLKMFREGISTLPPGKEIKTLFDSAIKRYPAELPEVYEVRVTYTDQDRRRRYDETMDLDFAIYWNRLSLTRRGIHHVHEELKRMREQMGKWSPNIGGGVLIRTREDVRAQHAESEEQELWWKEQQAEEPEGAGTDRDAEDAANAGCS